MIYQNLDETSKSVGLNPEIYWYMVTVDLSCVVSKAKLIGNPDN